MISTQAFLRVFRVFAVSVSFFVSLQFSSSEAVQGTQKPPILSAEQDHARIIEALHITALRRGADGDPRSENAANMDEMKANVFGAAPDPLRLKNGKEVVSEKVWWNQRRPEIVQDFESQIYGRVPSNAPKVRWEVFSTTPIVTSLCLPRN